MPDRCEGENTMRQNSKFGPARTEDKGQRESPSGVKGRSITQSEVMKDEVWWTAEGHA